MEPAFYHHHHKQVQRRLPQEELSVLPPPMLEKVTLQGGAPGDVVGCHGIPRDIVGKMEKMGR